MLLKAIAVLSLFTLYFICVTNSEGNTISCIDHTGKAVDWYAVYKLPRNRSLSGAIQTGRAYVYLTSETVAQGWQWLDDTIDSENTPFYRTLKPYYENDTSNMWVLYNDQMSGSTVKGNGHTKGVVGAGSNGGFWLVQSIPHYPPNRKLGYSYPSTGYRYGQSALCLTLPVTSLQAVGTAVKFNSPDVYDYFPGDPSLEATYSDLSSAAKGLVPKGQPWFHIQNITTKGGTLFTVFAKCAEFQQDLYELVSGFLQTDLYVEAWRLEWGPLPSSCKTKYRVFNVEEINIEGKVQFNTTHDHSKWAAGQKIPWTCIGDINRAVPQESRGGGTVCLYDQTFWEKYKNVIQKSDNCTKKTKWWIQWWNQWWPFKKRENDN